MELEKILNNDEFTSDEIIFLLKLGEEDSIKLFNKAKEVRNNTIGNKVYFRGLVEFSNKCSKNCYYCGIRVGNTNCNRYELTDYEVLDAIKYAFDNNFGSVVIQAGERIDRHFIDRIDNLLKEIKHLSSGKLGITLSLGEQTEETYSRWFASGAHRYLLRIEASDQGLYKKLHPNDENHDFEKRMEALQLLRKCGYQVGSGVMIGLPYQKIENLADDLLFLKNIDVDMVGMGPYIEHEDTPLYKYRDMLPSKEERFNLSLKMLAILRLMVKDINMAATTAMQTLDNFGREKALDAGANIIMPNLTPLKYRDSYLLYENKPGVNEEADDTKQNIEKRLKKAGYTIGYGEWGDSRHFDSRLEIS